jgi:hypothetical protein
MTSGILDRNKNARPSSRHPVIDVAHARDGSWGLLRFAWLYLAAIPSDVGANVDIQGLRAS